ncbi:AAA family ATPase [Dietzia maris]|uniref:AAA family ATPase n=1 Tax=Dietzia maris TaxID=37915 RepID=UPI0034502AB9
MAAPKNLRAAGARAQRMTQAARTQERQKAVASAREKIRTGRMNRSALASVPPPVPLHDGLTFMDSLARLASKPGLGKTFMALDMALSAATGRAWHGRRTAKVRVLYLVGEGLAGIDQRVTAWEAATGATVPDDMIDFLPIPLALHSEEAVDAEALAAEIADRGYEFVVVDTQARFTPGMEENSNSEAGILVANLDRLRAATGACVLLIHHTTMGTDRARGASALNGAMDTELVLADPDRPGLFELRVTKQKNAPEIRPERFRLESYAGSAVVVPEHGRSPSDPTPADMFARPIHGRGPLGSEKGDELADRAAFVLWRSWQHGTSGATKAEWKAALQGDADLKIPSKNVAARFGEAFSTLEARGWLTTGASSQRFRLTGSALEAMGVAAVAAPVPADGEPGSGDDQGGEFDEL